MVRVPDLTSPAIFPRAACTAGKTPNNSPVARDTARAKEPACVLTGDTLFVGGQDWGLPASIPKLSRLDGHANFRKAIARQLSVAGLLRIDHVMVRGIRVHDVFTVPLPGSDHRLVVADLGTGT